ncbi:MAG: Xaa-Pro dipeptidase [Candidatus Hepatoplasma vulgare]|nr:MAG: Xaa-Pro dipeptidase [Candidatus Hepatoplasma sp.]
MYSLNDLIKNKNIWFKNPDDCLYLTNFESSNLNVFYISGEWYALTDDRYIEAAKSKIKNMKVINISDFSFKNNFLPKIIETDNTLYIDENNFTLREYKNFKDRYKKIKILHIDLSNIRTIKNDEEINLIKKACKITDSIFKKFIEYVKPGISEKKLEKVILKLIIESEADNISFWPIIAAGENSASPHWKASDYILKKDDIITLDFGVKYKNYVSDMTRTFAVKNDVSIEEEKIHSLVLRGLNLAIKNAKVGVEIKKLDELVRKEFEKEGYEKNFNHALGHGIGINIHENPLIYSYNSEILKENMIITIEPGIYIPGKYGCRIEQDILIKKDKAIELNKANKNLNLKR